MANQHTEQKSLVYNPEQMRRLVENDAYLKFVFYNLLKKRGHNESNLLEMLFYSEVEGDTPMEQAYLSMMIEK